MGDTKMRNSNRKVGMVHEKHNVEKTLDEEVARHDQMLASGHMSPFEHQAKVASPDEIYRYASFRCYEPDRFTVDTIGNLRSPWLQYRKMLPGERVFGTGR